jgi:hypothetical protein
MCYVALLILWAREPSDFRKIEEDIAGDLGLYFKDTSQFDRMIVFVYDDCDKPRPERYDSLRNALMKRDRIEDLIIVRQPSIMPNRSKRNSFLPRQTDSPGSDEEEP